MSQENKHQNEVQKPTLRSDDAEKCAEARKNVTEKIGDALTDVFERDSEYVSKDENGVEDLTLYIPFHNEYATISLQRHIGEDGDEMVTMSFAAETAWSNHWIYGKGPDFPEPFLVPCSKDPETGKFKVKKEPQPTEDNPHPYDPTSDYEVAYWGGLWPENFVKASPEKPKQLKQTLRMLGKIARSIVR
jgi:hypothetical protein